MKSFVVDILIPTILSHHDRYWIVLFLISPKNTFFSSYKLFNIPQLFRRRGLVG